MNIPALPGWVPAFIKAKCWPGADTRHEPCFLRFHSLLEWYSSQEWTSHRLAFNDPTVIEILQLHVMNYLEVELVYYDRSNDIPHVVLRGRQTPLGLKHYLAKDELLIPTLAACLRTLYGCARFELVRWMVDPFVEDLRHTQLGSSLDYTPCWRLVTQGLESSQALIAAIHTHLAWIIRQGDS